MNGDRLVHGEQGEVMGPGDGRWAIWRSSSRTTRASIGCTPSELSRSPPPLSGGYKVGEKLYFTGLSETFGKDDRRVHGEVGEVMGPGGE